eukprot:TRINITY_DN636_c0_g1_i13.p1 TRINITY_DN636_c0_g1~~TRINITY_DN636_c0_g1_i13.p1  ORF type:complete len:178 (+),score=7.80 TRINITY_DN636_c0_g1_i13:72-536(+)
MGEREKEERKRKRWEKEKKRREREKEERKRKRWEKEKKRREREKEERKRKRGEKEKKRREREKEERRVKERKTLVHVHILKQLKNDDIPDWQFQCLRKVEARRCGLPSLAESRSLSGRSLSGRGAWRPRIKPLGALQGVVSEGSRRVGLDVSGR